MANALLRKISQRKDGIADPAPCEVCGLGVVWSSTKSCSHCTPGEGEQLVLSERGEWSPYSASPYLLSAIKILGLKGVLMVDRSPI
jgi:hypothetical protein